MHFEFSSHTHTHTHTVSCSLAVYLCPPRPTCVFQFDIKPFRAFAHITFLFMQSAGVRWCVFLWEAVWQCVYVCVCVCACACVFLCGVSGKRISRLLPPHIKINRRKCVLASYFASAQPRLSWGYFWAPFSSLSLPPWQMSQMSSFM